MVHDQIVDQVHGRAHTSQVGQIAGITPGTLIVLVYFPTVHHLVFDRLSGKSVVRKDTAYIQIPAS